MNFALGVFTVHDYGLKHKASFLPAPHSRVIDLCRLMMLLFRLFWLFLLFLFFDVTLLVGIFLAIWARQRTTFVETRGWSRTNCAR